VDNSDTIDAEELRAVLADMNFFEACPGIKEVQGLWFRV
jgi:hypothetical protein